jgi:hypothetical protein
MRFFKTNDSSQDKEPSSETRAEANSTAPHPQKESRAGASDAFWDDDAAPQTEAPTEQEASPSSDSSQGKEASHLAGLKQAAVTGAAVIMPFIHSGQALAAPYTAIAEQANRNQAISIIEHQEQTGEISASKAEKAKKERAQEAEDESLEGQVDLLGDAYELSQDKEKERLEAEQEALEWAEADEMRQGVEVRNWDGQENTLYRIVESDELQYDLEGNMTEAAQDETPDTQEAESSPADDTSQEQDSPSEDGEIASSDAAEDAGEDEASTETQPDDIPAATDEREALSPQSETSSKVEAESDSVLAEDVPEVTKDDMSLADEARDAPTSEALAETAGEDMEAEESAEDTPDAAAELEAATDAPGSLTADLAGESAAQNIDTPALTSVAASAEAGIDAADIGLGAETAAAAASPEVDLSSSESSPEVADIGSPDVSLAAESSLGEPSGGFDTGSAPGPEAAPEGGPGAGGFGGPGGA